MLRLMELGLGVWHCIPEPNLSRLLFNNMLRKEGDLTGGWDAKEEAIIS